MTNLSLLLVQMAALQAHMQAVMAAIERELGEVGVRPESGGCPKCGAPEEHVKDSSAIAGPRTSQCTQCGAEWER